CGSRMAFPLSSSPQFYGGELTGNSSSHQGESHEGDEDAGNDGDDGGDFLRRDTRARSRASVRQQARHEQSAVGGLRERAQQETVRFSRPHPCPRGR
ncbi:MAG: hypothetical protein Q8O19_07490, partial [Rectinemataceae bacterium]|nr:hypothetical protein [Rectinemataceae bacterium]